MDPSMLQPGIFNHPRPKKPVLPHANKKRKIEHKIEEISFDDNSREEYLTGFHKRKVQRIKRAQEEAAKKAKEEHRETRKQVRSAKSARIGKLLIIALVARRAQAGIRRACRSYQ